MWILTALCFTAGLALFDIVLKSCIENTMVRGEERTACKGKLILRKVYNKGFCLNIMEEKTEIVQKVSLFGTLFLTVWQMAVLMQKKQRIKKAGISLLTAGAWSNTFDRLTRGYVIDYLAAGTKNKKIKNITFNLGDLFLAAGSILILISSLFGTGKKK